MSNKPPTADPKRVEIEQEKKNKMQFEVDVVSFLQHLTTKIKPFINGWQLIDGASLKNTTRRKEDKFLLCDLKSGGQIRLQVYVGHMIDNKELDKREICVSLRYREGDVKDYPWKDLPVYLYYPWDVNILSEKIIEQIEKLK